MTDYLLDCDPGHDDAVALLVAARHLNLVAVTTVFGNSTISNTTRNALSILDAAGLKIPVYRGSEGALVGELASGESVHGKSGLDGAHLPPPFSRQQARPAVEAIVEFAESREDPVIIAVAPLTNVAQAIHRSPDSMSRIREISVMGGSTSFGNATPAAEFNIFADPEAASIVFDSGIPIRMVGLNVTTTFGLTVSELEQLQTSNSSLAGELAGALNFYLSRQSALYQRKHAPIHDVCAVVPYIDHSYINYERLHVSIECKGEYTRGQTLCDLRGIVAGEGLAPPLSPNADVAVSARDSAILDLVMHTLLTYP